MPEDPSETLPDIPPSGQRSIGRLLIIIGALTSLVIVALASAVAFRLSNEDAILDDMAQVMQSVSNETVENSARFLGPAERSAQELANLAEVGLFSDGIGVDADQIFFEVLKVNESFDGIFIGSGDGSFLYVRRETEGNGYRTKHIEVDDAGNRTVEILLYDDAYRLIESSFDPEDTYDPRVRPWFEKATEAGPNSGVWTSPYIFFSSGLPGVTRANATTPMPNGEAQVIGIDIRIDALSTFINDRRASANGRSFIIDRDLNIIAYPDKSVLSGEDGLATTSDVDDPLLGFLGSEVDSVARDGTPNLFRASVADTDYHFVTTSLVNNDEWVIGVAAPDDDFLGRVRDEQQRTRALTALGGTVSVLSLLTGGWVINRRYKRERSLAEAALSASIARSEERDAARAKLAKTVEQLGRSNADLEQYAYATAHDLRTPLRAMGGYAELMLREVEETDLDSTVEGYAHRIIESYERMCLTMDNLLEHARTAVHETPQESLPLAPIMAQVLGDFESEIVAAGADIQVGVLPPAAVDPIQIARVFQNLISNALRYRDEGRRLELAITGEQVKDRSIVSFADNGVGIAAADRDRVFQLFKRLSTDDAGSGVGLSLVKKIVEEHGGTITLESVEGEGSTFRISLPTEPVTSESEEQSGSPSSSVASGV